MSGKSWIRVIPRNIVPGDGIRFVHAPTGLQVDGRVVDVARSRTAVQIWIERTAVRGDRKNDRLLPAVVGVYGLTDLGGDVLRHVEHGPENRADQPGRAYLRTLLQEAADGDETIPAAVEKVSACVLASEIEVAGYAERAPYQMGTVAATDLLSGSKIFSEAVLRQLKGAIVEPSLPPMARPKRMLPKFAPPTRRADDGVNEASRAQ